MLGVNTDHKHSSGPTLNNRGPCEAGDMPGGGGEGLLIIMTSSTSEPSLWAGHCALCLTWMISSDSHNKPSR